MDLKPLFVFPRWSNTVTLSVLLFLAIFPLYAGALLGYALDPVTLNVGYAPTQPVPYSHALHVGQLGIDCRYCHNTVEKADFAAIPPTETCMNCHKAIKPNSDLLKPVRESYLTGKPVQWRMVTTIPDYVYFNHAAHVNGGVSCIECHGPIHQMDVVYQASPMNMAWCLQCHREPEKHIRPKDRVTHLFWTPSAEDPSTVAAFADAPDLQARAAKLGVTAPATQGAGGNSALAQAYVRKLAETQSLDSVRLELGKLLKDKYHINPNTDCITCHR